MPRFEHCSFFPYTLNENGHVVLLLRTNKDSKTPNFYLNFGTTLKETDPNIFYSAARSYVTKTFGLGVASESENMNIQSEIEKKIKDFSFKSEMETFSNPKVKEVLTTIITS